MDGEFCTIPFEFNGIQNNFCVIDEEIEENDALQCETNAGLSNCTLGIMLINNYLLNMFETRFEN